MILVDVNLIIYATDRDSPHHKRVRAWWEQTLSGTMDVGLAWIVLLAFIRITTHGGIMRRPLGVEQALAYVDSWLHQPYVHTIMPGVNHWPILQNLLKTLGAAGNLTSDVHLAALAIEYGASIYSADYDFRRFPGVTHINPLES